jgi:serine/threonine protein phosphatase PrpC
MARSTISYGASVRGPLHHSEGLPNQDAWLRASGRFGSLIVVCDGLGSKPHSRTGAKAACAAARDAVAKWARTVDAPVSYLAHLTEVYWRLRIHPLRPEDAATTCLIALAHTSGQWIVGGVGDGLAVVKTGEEPVFPVVGDRGIDFSSETKALGASQGPRSWQWSVLQPTRQDRVAVLATDGVSDDLLGDKLDGFCNWLVEDFRELDPPSRWRRLQAELWNWPTPKHLDDKTLAVLTVSAATTGKL